MKNLILTYFIGASKHWPGATIFWQIDKHEKVHTGQVILYDKSTGKRIQKPYPHITWVHSLLIKQGKLKSFNLQQCLFGEHQLIDSPTNKPIAIVESAKSAIIMTGYYPNYIWMATNGSHNIKPEFFQPIKDRNIILYPDLGQNEKWNLKAIELQKQDFKITTSNLLEKNATPEDHTNGLDIADYFLTNQSKATAPINALSHSSINLSNQQINTSPHFHITKFSNSKKALSKDDTLFNTFITKYPNILHLENALDLINPKTKKSFNLASTNKPL